MDNMKELLKETNESLGKIGENSPEQMNAFMGLLKAIESKGALDEKHKELIAIACSVVSHCKWCIASHVNSAFEKGANEEEIREASWVGVLMGGGPALMYHQLVEKAIEDLKK